VDRAPRFSVGSAVRAADVHPTGHTRLPRYVRGRQGVVVRVHPAFIFPDTHAHGEGEQPQHVYAVRFAAEELWGEGAGTHNVTVDLFEPHLEPA
jgi:nitrile hydratase